MTRLTPHFPAHPRHFPIPPPTTADPTFRIERTRNALRTLEHATVLSRGNLIEAASLPERITKRRKEPLVAERSYRNPTLEVIERAYIMWVLQAEGGNKTRAAEVLGIDPSTLYRKLSRYEEQVEVKA
jgi:DNA-binding NtrC family response regulator